MEGALTANGQRLGTRDAARIGGDGAAPTRLELSAEQPEGAHFMIIEMAQA
jgi:hypothetical protein